MLLNLDQIRAITKGAVRVEQENGRFCFFRFTEAQVNSYANAGKTDFYNKTFASAGVRLAFKTTSRKLAFDYFLTPASSRRFAWFDVYEDGSMRRHFGTEGGEVTAGHAEIDLHEGETTVEVYLPWSYRTDLANVSIEDGATLEPVCRKRTMISFGDSITHGYDATYPSLSYASRLARLLDADAINKGIGGDCFFPALLEKPDPIDPDMITVAYGTNDWNGRTKEHFAKDCGAFYARLSELYRRAQIYAITPIWRGDAAKATPFGAHARTVHDMIESLCRALPNVTLIRAWDFVPHLKEFFSDFYLHPNDQGFGIYAANLYRAIKENDRQ